MAPNDKRKHPGFAEGLESEPELDPAVAILAAVKTQEVSEDEFAESVSELGRLAYTLGLRVAATITQNREGFHPGSYLGSGKLAELKEAVEEHHAGVVLLDHEVSPSQADHVETACGARVMDRTAVILEIFHRHARSRAAKAQVEIVRLEYMAPRLRALSKGTDRARGGIGAKGAGESGVELDRRKIRDRIAELTQELSGLEQEHRTQRARRQALNRVALVGYTNAGKSTLMRALTGSDAYIADKLFATLDTTVRALYPATKPKILVSDTVGFINHLPHGLVTSFKTTLDEATEASLLLHVVDASDPGFVRQLDVTAEVLEDIGAGPVRRILVLNKIDRVGDAEVEAAATRQLLAEYPEAIVMSARRPEDVARLRQLVIDIFAESLVEGLLRVPYDRQQLRGEIYESCNVLDETYEPDAVIFRVKTAPGELARLEAKASPPSSGEAESTDQVDD